MVKELVETGILDEKACRITTRQKFYQIVSHCHTFTTMVNSSYLYSVEAKEEL